MNQECQVITVKGIDPDQLYSGNTLITIIEQLLKFQAEGGEVVVEKTAPVEAAP